MKNRIIKAVGFGIGIPLAVIFMLIGIATVANEKKPQPAVSQQQVEDKTQAEARAKAEQEARAKAEQEAKAKAEQEKKAEAAYLQWLSGHSNRMMSIITDLNKLLQIRDGFLLDEWHKTLALVCKALERETAEAKNYGPVPERFKELHRLYLKAMDEFSIVAAKLPSDFQRLDTNAISDDGNRMIRASDYITQTTIELKRLQNEITQ